MIYLVGFIFLFTFYQLVSAFANWLWKQSLHFPTKSDALVSVLIPARNEAENIGLLIEGLQKQTHQKIEIIVFNDQSEDNTKEIVESYAKNDERISLINSKKLPANWLGKNYACYRLAQKAKGKFYLFLDADVSAKPELVSHTLGFVQKHETGLLSIFPKQEMKTPGEKVTVPLMHYILLSMLPLVLVRKSPYASHSAANGQFMLFDAAIYDKIQPHRIMKKEKVEDIKISRLLKRQKISVACLTGTELITCRMYQSFSDAVNGFSRNIIMFFGNSYFFAVTFWLVVTLGFLPVLIFSNTLFFIYLGLFILTKIFVSLAAKQSIVNNLLLFFPQQIAMAAMIFKSIKGHQTWKGRNI